MHSPFESTNTRKVAIKSREIMKPLTTQGGITDTNSEIIIGLLLLLLHKENAKIQVFNGSYNKLIEKGVTRIMDPFMKME